MPVITSSRTGKVVRRTSASTGRVISSTPTRTVQQVVSKKDIPQVLKTRKISGMSAGFQEKLAEALRQEAAGEIPTEAYISKMLKQRRVITGEQYRAEAPLRQVQQQEKLGVVGKQIQKPPFLKSLLGFAFEPKATAKVWRDYFRGDIAGGDYGQWSQQYLQDYYSGGQSLIPTILPSTPPATATGTSFFGEIGEYAKWGFMGVAGIMVLSIVGGMLKK